MSEVVQDFAIVCSYFKVKDLLGYPESLLNSTSGINSTQNVVIQCIRTKFFMPRDEVWKYG